MKIFIFSFFLAGTILAQQVDSKVKETAINIAIGIDESIKFEYKITKKLITIGKEDILSLGLIPSKRELTFKGLKPGKTSVTIRDTTGDIRDKYIVTVTSDGNSNTVRELRELIGDIEGIDIGIRGGKVIVDGEIVVPDQIGKINTILAKYPDVLLLIEHSKQTQLIVAREMQDAVNRNGMKDVTINFVNGDYWLEGAVNSEGKKTLAFNIANAYLPNSIQGLSASSGGSRFQGKIKGSIVNFINVNEKKDPEPPPKLIKVSSQFVELSKDYSKVFAFKWAPFMSNESSIQFGKNTDGGISTSESGTLSGTISRLFPKLQSAKNAGYARVIQSGMAVTNNNKNILIKKNTDLNFSVGSGEGQEAKTTSITFSMATKPVIRNEENVELGNLNINVSVPAGIGENGTPKVASNEIKTNITVKSGESAVIGGVVQTNAATAYDKDDPDNKVAQSSSGEDSAAQASTLFNLIRSKSYTTSKSQFVVFVTPEILESASKGTAEIKRKFKKRSR